MLINACFPPTNIRGWFAVVGCHQASAELRETKLQSKLKLFASNMRFPLCFTQTSFSYVLHQVSEVSVFCTVSHYSRSSRLNLKLITKQTSASTVQVTPKQHIWRSFQSDDCPLVPQNDPHTLQTHHNLILNQPQTNKSVMWMISMMTCFFNPKQ